MSSCVKYFLIVFFWFLQTGLYSLSLKVDKLNIHEEALAGDIIEGVVNVINEGDRPAYVSTGIEDFDFDGVKQSVLHKPFGTQKDSCSKWIRFTPKRLEVPPQSSFPLKYTITVPKEGLTFGQYFSFLYIESEVGKPDLAQAIVLGSKARVGIIVKITLKEIAKPLGEITQFEIVPPENEGSSYQIQYAFNNKGNTLQIITGSFSIIDADGNLYGRGTLKRGICQFGESINMTTLWDGDLDIGEYDMIAEIKFDPQEAVIEEKRFLVD